MPLGTLDLLILLIMFLGLQAWWIYPIIKNTKKLIKGRTNFKEKITNLEKLYKR